MKKILFLFLTLVTLNSFSQEDHSMHMKSTDKASTHGMLLFGKEKIYASHLPMFHSPHNYQIILELELDKTTTQKYIADQKLHPECTTYTIEPEKFVLPEMIENPKSFSVDLYRGHFERGGIKIASKAIVKIVKVIYFKKFDENEAKATISNFILFGNAKEQFLAHQITNKPDFEQIIKVKTKLSSDKNEIITVDTTANTVLGINGNEIEIDKKTIVLLKQLYLEFNDLKQ